MYLARVTGALASTTKHTSLNGSKLLVVARLDEDCQPTVHAQVAVDIVSTGNGETVIIIADSSAYMSNNKDHLVVDAAVVGITDSLELNG